MIQLTIVGLNSLNEQRLSIIGVLEIHHTYLG